MLTLNYLHNKAGKIKTNCYYCILGYIDLIQRLNYSICKVGTIIHNGLGYKCRCYNWS